MAKTLRQRIRYTGINCKPWSFYKGEIDYLPISAKILFRNNGMSIDIWEDVLKSEGWLFSNECLLQVLKEPSNLKRGRLQDICEEESLDTEFGLMPQDFTEEDFDRCLLF